MTLPREIKPWYRLRARLRSDTPSTPLCGGRPSEGADLPASAVLNSGTPQPDPARGGSDRSQLSHVVVGFDGSPASYDALAFAAGWAQRVGVQLDIVYVTDPSQHWLAYAGAAVSPISALPDFAPDLSAEVAAAMSGCELAWAYVVASGGVAQELECHAKRLSADAIVIGRSHRCPRALRSSLAHRVVSCADRIVIVVP